jgi:purine nucleoside permease
MRTAYNFARPAPNMSAADSIFNGQTQGYNAAVLNIYLASIKVLQGITAGWDDTFG